MVTTATISSNMQGRNSGMFLGLKRPEKTSYAWRIQKINTSASDFRFCLSEIKQHFCSHQTRSLGSECTRNAFCGRDSNPEPAERAYSAPELLSRFNGKGEYIIREKETAGKGKGKGA